MPPQSDNSTLDQKAALRVNAIRYVPGPVLETHGGYGEIWKRCYSDRVGFVLEKDRAKVDALAKQRPTWAVYECESAAALTSGLAADVPFAVLDVDPYGMPWPVLEAFFEGQRAFADTMVATINDGTRGKLSTNAGHEINNKTIKWAVREFGNSQMHQRYLEIARACLERVVKNAGYRIEAWAAYNASTFVIHYAARLVR